MPRSAMTDAAVKYAHLHQYRIIRSSVSTSSPDLLECTVASASEGQHITLQVRQPKQWTNDSEVAVIDPI